jgi:hypothetical protein
MNKMKWVLVPVVVVVLAVLVIMNRQASQPTVGTASQTESAGLTTPSVAVEPPEPPPLVPPKPPPPEALEFTAPIQKTQVMQEGSEPQAVMLVKPEQVLATVNGTPVTLQDLAAVPDMQLGREQTITPSLYNALLERAVIREVAVQAAEARGIELSDEQQAVLEKMKAQMTSTSPDVKDMTMSPERLAFDLRDTQGRMLIVNMVTEAGAPSAFVTEDQVKAYYETHMSEYGALPSDPDEAKWAWRKIDREIRNALVADTTASYQQAYDQVVEDLKSEASIEMTDPMAP